MSFMFFNVVVRRGARFLGAFCLYSFTNTPAARDCNSDPSFSSLFLPLVTWLMATVHWKVDLCQEIKKQKVSRYYLHIQSQ